MKTSAFTYRRLREEDLPQVAALEKKLFPTPWTEQQYAAMMRQGGCALFGAFHGRGLAGYIAVAVRGAVGEMEIYNIAVDERYRRNGIGRKMLALSLSAAAKAGVTAAFLEARVTNFPAIALYQTLGFVQTGVRKGYYHDTGEDALIYVCSL